MAGHRRAVNGRTARPTQAEKRWTRRRKWLAEKIGEASGPAGQVTAAMEYARAAVRELPPHVAAQVAHQIHTEVVALVDRAAKVKTGAGR